MVTIIHCKLSVIVQLPGFAGLYADACIGVGRALMGVIRKILGAYKITVIIGVVELVAMAGAVGLSGLSAVFFFFPTVVAVHQFFARVTHFIFAIVVEFFSIIFDIIKHFLFYQAIHACIGFYKCTVNGLALATHHSLFYTKAQYFFKQHHKYFFAIQTTRAANSAMPGQGFVKIVFEI